MRLRDHIALAWVTGILVGIVEVARLVDAGSQAGLTVVAGAALAGFAGALAGLVQAGVCGAVRVGSRAAKRLDVSSSSASSSAAPLEPASAVRRRAAVAGLLLSGVAFAVGLTLAFARLAGIQDPELVETLRVIVAGGGALLSLALAAVLGGLLIGPFAALDRRRPFPWLASAVWRRLLLAGVAGGLGFTLLAVLGERLGPLGWAPFGLVFVSAELYLAVLVGEGGRRIFDRRPRVVVLALTLTSIAALGLAEARRTSYAALAETRTPRIGQALLHLVTDVDGDGFAPLLGGGDCAPLDPRISPAASEIPGNGIDENCDGEDGVAGDEGQIIDPYLSRSRALPIRDYDVVWIIVDALRADHVSGLGYRQSTTPYLDHLGEEALVFTSAYSQSSATMMSIPSMLSGRDPLAAEWMHDNERLALTRSVPMISERLRERGYHTSIIVTSYIYQRLSSIMRGYAETVDAALRQAKVPGGRRASSSTADSALMILHRLFADPDASPSPYLLTVYFEDPHRPYSPRSSVFPAFKGPHARYDREIAATDRHIGFILDGLRLSPRWDKTIVIVTADHGEEFKEHGGRFHARTCYEESVHVPLVVRIPGVAPQRIEQPVALIDIVPTLVELLGLDREVELDGQSLLIPALEPERASPDRPIFCAVISQKPSQGHFFREAVRAGRYLLEGDVITGDYQLFDRLQDPGEHRPLVAHEGPARAIVERLRAILIGARRGNLGERLLTR